MTVTVMPVAPTHQRFGQAVDLFDEYRVHYGQAPSLEATRAWLSQQLIGERMFLAAAVDDTDRMRGFITTTVLPASLMLGTFWSIRDLYVVPRYRGVGIAGRLLQYTIADAQAAGALRVSLQTETDNTPALALYTAAGFQPVDGLQLRSLTLVPEKTA